MSKSSLQSFHFFNIHFFVSHLYTLIKIYARVMNERPRPVRKLFPASAPSRRSAVLPVETRGCIQLA